MINRRGFILSTISGVVGLSLPSTGFKYVPHPAQLKFFSQPDIPTWLYGIPYHHTDASIGQWLGIPRKAAYEDLGKLVRKLNEHISE